MHNNTAGLRTIAMFEASKGLLAFIVAIGIHALSGQNIQQAMEQLVTHMHLNPASHFPSIIIRAAGELTSPRLMYIALGSLAYTAVRFIEAYGLWHGKQWTEWFALISGAIYIPFELQEMFLHLNALSVAIVLINSLMVWYLALILLKAHRQKRSSNIY